MTDFSKHPVTAAKNAWSKSLISDHQLQILHRHYHAILEQVEVSPDEFGEIFIHAIRLKMMRVEDMIDLRKT